MPPPKNQLAAALKNLELLIQQGNAARQEDPAQFEQVKELYAELKRVTPGQAPPAKVAALLQGFLGGQLDAQREEAKARLAESRGRVGPVALKDTAAHAKVLDALTQARHGLSALGPTASPALVESTAVRLASSNEAAARALGDAQAARALGASAHAAPKK